MAGPGLLLAALLDHGVLQRRGPADEYEPAGWGLYAPSWVEISILAGSFAWFFFWFLLFSKTMPTISIAEIKEHIVHQKEGGH